MEDHRGWGTVLRSNGTWEAVYGLDQQNKNYPWLKTILLSEERHCLATRQTRALKSASLTGAQ